MKILVSLSRPYNISVYKIQDDDPSFNKSKRTRDKLPLEGSKWPVPAVIKKNARDLKGTL